MAPVLFGTGAESIDRKDLLAQQRLGLGYDIVGAEAEGLQQGTGGAGVAEFIIDAHPLHGHGVLFAEAAAHSLAQAADDVVLFNG